MFLLALLDRRNVSTHRAGSFTHCGLKASRLFSCVFFSPFPSTSKTQLDPDLRVAGDLQIVHCFRLFRDQCHHSVPMPHSVFTLALVYEPVGVTHDVWPGLQSARNSKPLEQIT